MIGAILVLACVSYMVGRQPNMGNFREKLEEWQRRPKKRRLNHRAYLEEVKESANQKYWAEKRRAEDKERVRESFLQGKK